MMGLEGGFFMKGIGDVVLQVYDVASRRCAL